MRAARRTCKSSGLWDIEHEEGGRAGREEHDEDEEEEEEEEQQRANEPNECTNERTGERANERDHRHCFFEFERAIARSIATINGS